MAKKDGKGINTPYVHPTITPDGRQVFNQAGSDGYSFDEVDDEKDLPYDDDEKDTSSNTEYTDDEIKAFKADMLEQERKVAQERALEDYNNLSSDRAAKLSDKELCDIYDAAMEAKDLEDDQLGVQ